MARPKGSKNGVKKEQTPAEQQAPIDCNVPEVQTDNKTIAPDSNRKKELVSILKDINKKLEGVTANFASEVQDKGRLSFGYKCLDNLTGGGIPQGVFTTLWGSKGCGKTSLAYKAIATNQKQGKIAVYIDMERSYDALWAKTFGVDIENLVYVSCHTAEEALDVIIKLCREKVVDLIILDSIQGLSPHGEQYEGKADKEKSVQADSMALLARKLSQFFRMATPYISDAQCAVVLIGQARMDLGSFIKMEVLSGGHALMHNSRLIMKLRRGQGADAPEETILEDSIDENGNESQQKVKVRAGFDLVVKIEKSQINGCLEGSELHVPFLYKSGIKEES